MGTPRGIPPGDPPKGSTQGINPSRVDPLGDSRGMHWGDPGGCPPSGSPLSPWTTWGTPWDIHWGEILGGELWHTLGIPARIPCGLSGAIQRGGWPSWCDPIGPPPRGVPSRDPPRGSLESPREFPQGTPCGPPTKEPLEIGSNFSAVIPRLFFSGDGR